MSSLNYYLLSLRVSATVFTIETISFRSFSERLSNNEFNSLMLILLSSFVRPNKYSSIDKSNAQAILKMFSGEGYVFPRSI